MNDYFGALMRSSGMAIAGAASAIAQPPSVEASAMRIDGIESNAPTMPARTVETGSATQQAAAAVRGADAVERPAPSAAGRAAPQVPAVPAGFAIPPQAVSGAAANAAIAGPPAAAAAVVVETPKPAVGQALIRAAMQWVAADPRQDRSVTQLPPPRERSQLAVAEEIRVIGAAQARRDEDAEPQAPPSIAPPGATTIATPQRPGARGPVRALEVPVLTTRAVPREAFVRDDVVEVSIGAIHVRVDAPAVQTVVRTPVMPPAAAPRTTPQGNALSRRALRRI